MSERSNNHNTSGDQEINPGDTAPDPAADVQEDQAANQGSDEFGKQSEKIIAGTVGNLAINLRR